MNVYNYDEITKEFTGACPADADPESTKIAGYFVPLIPANATLSPVPNFNTKCEIPVREGDKWVIKPDYRKNYYKVDKHMQVLPVDSIGAQDGYYIVEKSLGELISANPLKYKIVDDEIVEKTDEELAQYKLALAKDYKLSENQIKRDARLNAGVMYKGILFDSDVDQKTNLQFMAASMSDEDTIVWNGKNNDPLECTKEDILGIGAKIAELTLSIWGQDGLNISYISAIEAAETVEDVEAIEIDYETL